MKGKRPPARTSPPAEIPDSMDDVRCSYNELHCWHLISNNTYAEHEVCCHCGKDRYFAYGREEEHGPFVQNRPLPDNPHYHSSFVSTSSCHGTLRGMDQRNVSRADPDAIYSDMDDSTVAKWLR